MTYDEFRRRIENMQAQIKREGTGDPNEFANELGISRRTLFYDLERLRDEGAIIKFSRSRKTYYFA